MKKHLNKGKNPVRKEGDRRPDDVAAAPAEVARSREDLSSATRAELSGVVAILEAARQRRLEAARNPAGAASELDEQCLGDGASAKAAELAEMISDEKRMRHHFNDISETYNRKQRAILEQLKTITERIYYLRAKQLIINQWPGLERVKDDLAMRLKFQEHARAGHEAMEKELDKDFNDDIDAFLQHHKDVIRNSNESDHLTRLLKDIRQTHTIDARETRHKEMQDYMQRQGIINFRQGLLRFFKDFKIEPYITPEMDILFHAIAKALYGSHASASHPGHQSHSGGSGSVGGGSNGGSSSQHAGHHPHPHPGHGKQGGPSG